VNLSDRRQALIVIASACGLAPLLFWLGAPSAAGRSGEAFPVQRTDDEWRALLAPERYRILRSHGTERAHSSPLNHEKRAGRFVCAGCGQALFASAAKYDSGTGWPSFWQPLDGAVGTDVDRSWLMVRTEVHCARCGGHLGHVFRDGPEPTGLRYCINGLALTFAPDAGGSGSG
jgi:peptide-methionine (R)-S-oxide reductase